MGRDSLSPFLAEADRGVFVLCRTSNAGGADLQDLELAAGDSLYERVATLADTWNEHGNVGLVVGATHPEELESIRTLVPEVPFLVPGVGAQGGDTEAAVTHGLAERDGWPVGVGLVNSSRGIIFAGEDRGDAAGRGGSDDAFASAAGAAAKRLKERLNAHR
jgi:orotidine-5'-phosphate decarboxylase